MKYRLDIDENTTFVCENQRFAVVLERDYSLGVPLEDIRRMINRYLTHNHEDAWLEVDELDDEDEN